MASAALGSRPPSTHPSRFPPVPREQTVFDRGLDSPAALAIWLDGHVASTAVARQGCATLPHCRHATKFSQGLTLLGRRRRRQPGRVANARTMRRPLARESIPILKPDMPENIVRVPAPIPELKPVWPGNY